MSEPSRALPHPPQHGLLREGQGGVAAQLQ